MPTRAALLSDERHRIRFVYTPKHTWWLNQIDIWFSILVCKMVKRGSFASTEALKAQIEAFILYFNRTMARAFKWTYKGRPLQAQSRYKLPPTSTSRIAGTSRILC